MDASSRSVVSGTSLAPIGGYIDPGEAPATAAERELLEETGYRAARWVSLGSYPIDGNRGVGTAHFFLALDAEQVGEEAHVVGSPGGVRRISDGIVTDVLDLERDGVLVYILDMAAASHPATAACSAASRHIAANTTSTPAAPAAWASRPNAPATSSSTFMAIKKRIGD